MESIPYYDQPPSYEEFYNLHLRPNVPALFGPALTASWKARQEWIEPSAAPMANAPHMKPRYETLKALFGDAEVQVADCGERDFTDQKRSTMAFAAFVDCWQKEPGRYYLKDWHFVKAFPDYHAYDVPNVFADDWMNEYWIGEGKDDYRFVYMGGHDTFTPFHADVYRSYSWSSNICGIKKWTLFPPGQEHLFKDKLNNMVYDVRAVDPDRFPHFEKAKRIVIYQRDGETLFVPSGWFHQVENIGATISINHNWSNACNLGLTYQSLANDLADVRASLEDLEATMEPMEFVDTCQNLLLIHSGWNWSVFVSMLRCITRRLATETVARLQPPPTWQLGEIQRILDLLEAEPYLTKYLDPTWLDEIHKNMEM